MKFSTRSTYGLRALSRLADNYGKGSLSLAKIAKEEHISLGYLERIFSKLKKGGLVISEKGTQGGYSLSKKPEEINIFEVLKVLEGNVAVFQCVDSDGGLKCSSTKCCSAASSLGRVQNAVHESLRKMSLNSI